MTDRIRTATLAALVVLSALAVAAPATAATDDAELSLAPAGGQVATGESVTYGVVADVDGGVGSYGLNVTVDDPGTATITNVSSEIGGTARTRVDGAHARIAAVGGDAVDNGSGVLVATVTVTGDAAGNATVSLAPTSLTDGSGDRYGIAAVHDATVTVTDGSEERPTGLSLAPPGRGVSPGDIATYDILVGDVAGGVGSYDLDVTIDDPGTATIVGVTNRIGGTTRTSVGDATARIAAVGGDTADGGSDVVVATVTVRAEATGSTGLSLAPASLSDEDGDRYRVTGADGATLDVTETAPTIGASDAPAGDPDGDGVYEDVNGDGEVTPGDATVLANALRGGDPAVVTNPEACDVDGDGRVTRGDATALFRSALAD